MLTSEPRGTVYVQDLDADADASALDVVIGVGVKARLDTVGVVGLEGSDLLDDVLRPASTLGSPQEIVDKALPLLLRHKANTPVYRYLRDAGLLNDDGTPRDPAALPPRVLKRVNQGSTANPPLGRARRPARRSLARAVLGHRDAVGRHPALLRLPRASASLIPMGLVLSFLAYVARNADQPVRTAFGWMGAAVVVLAASAFLVLQPLAASMAASGTGGHGHTSDRTTADTASQDSHASGSAADTAPAAAQDHGSEDHVDGH